MASEPPPIQQPVSDIDDRKFSQTWLRWFGSVYRNIEETLSTGVTSVNGKTGVVTLNLDDLGDVSAGAPSTGDILSFNGSWINKSYNSLAPKIRNTSNTTITNAYYHYFGNTDGGSFTYTLPAGVDGESYRIVNTGTSGNDLIVSPDGSENLLGANTTFNLRDGKALILIYDTNDGWY